MKQSDCIWVNRNYLLTQALYSLIFRVHPMFRPICGLFRTKFAMKGRMSCIYIPMKSRLPSSKKNSFFGSRNWFPGSEIIATGSTSSRGFASLSSLLIYVQQSYSTLDPLSQFLFIEKASHESLSNICVMLNLLICSYKHY